MSFQNNSWNMNSVDIQTVNSSSKKRSPKNKPLNIFDDLNPFDKIAFPKQKVVAGNVPAQGILNSSFENENPFTLKTQPKQQSQLPSVSLSDFNPFNTMIYTEQPNQNNLNQAQHSQSAANANPFRQKNNNNNNKNTFDPFSTYTSNNKNVTQKPQHHVSDTNMNEDPFATFDNKNLFDGTLNKTFSELQQKIVVKKADDPVDLNWLFADSPLEKKISLDTPSLVYDDKEKDYISDSSSKSSSLASSSSTSANNEFIDFVPSVCNIALQQKMKFQAAEYSDDRTQYLLIDQHAIEKGRVVPEIVKRIVEGNSLCDIGALPEVTKGYKSVRAILNVMKREYLVRDLNSPIFFLKHKKYGNHLLFGSLSSLNAKQLNLVTDLHPFVEVAKSRDVKQLIVLSENQNKIESALKNKLVREVGCTIKVICGVDENFKVIRKEFSRQCVKLFDKIVYGNGGLQTLPGFDILFSVKWSKFMKHYQKAVKSAYLCGDLKGYLLLLSAFWGLTLHFKPKNRCHDLSGVLSSHITRNVRERLPQALSKKETSVLLCNINLLFKPEGLIKMLYEEGWKVTLCERSDIISYRTKTGSIPFVVGHKSATKTGALQHEITKTGMHGKSVLGWNKSSRPQ